MEQDHQTKPGFKDVPLEQAGNGVLIPITGPKRWCCICQVDRPMKGGTIRAGMFRCEECLKLAAEKAAAKKAAQVQASVPSSVESTTP